MSEHLKLTNQVCFPIYSLAKEIVSHYRPFLDELGVTYPQYLVLMVLWEHQEQTVSQLGEKLNLDSGTLTPLLKRLEQKSIITRARSTQDERVVKIKLTKEGENLQKKAEKVPLKLFESLHITKEELIQLKNVIDKTLNNLNTKKI